MTKLGQNGLFFKPLPAVTIAPLPADPAAALARAAAYSRWLAGRLSASPGLGDELCAHLGQPFSRAEMSAWLGLQGCGDEASLGKGLRQLRQRVLARLIVRDLGGLADLAEVTATMTDLAEVAVQAGLACLHGDLAGIFGEPLDGSGHAQQLIVVGMGKLGGGELNVSSDIDLIFVYPEDGETAGPRKLSNHEFFVRLGKRLIKLLNEGTADGFVFRVDMRLRPYGDSGPLVSSFAMLEQYFYTQAREWERYAWIKGRAISGGARHSDRILELEKLRRPFVFRKYLDFGAFGAMRELHAQIRQEVARRDRADDIKLGPGGIREIEFIAQVFQLIRGGQQPGLQARPTRAILDQLAAHHHLPADTALLLRESYVLLRNLEHRLQYLEDAQTQKLPHGIDERRKVALAMGFADWEGFEAHLNTLRRKVSEHFEQVFGAPQEDQSRHPLAGLCNLSGELATARLAELGYSDAAAVWERLHSLRSGSRYQALPAASKAALEGLLPPIIEVAANFANADDTLGRILDLLEAVSRRAPYLKLLREYPQTLNQIARLASASPWAARYLRQRPLLLDELLDPGALYAPPDWLAARQELAGRLAGFAGDVERQMDELRHFKHSATFRLLAQDLAGTLTIERLSDHLADLADLLVDATLGLVWADLPGRHRHAPAFAVIAYGKLGGKELGYASDLDMVFLYDDDHPEAKAIYARLGKRLITWLSTMTAAGVLYDADLRLRPDGAAGLLVSSVAAFADYQHRQAWTWEHQALTRARYCCGDRTVGKAFEAIRQEVLRLPRQRDELREKVLEMRQKMRDGHANDTPLFDVKHDAGGLVDVEFSVQYLVLAHAHDYAELTSNVGNIALLGRCAALGLLPEAVAGDAADAYRELRRLQHLAKLQGDEFARVPHEQAAECVKAGRRLWACVFGTVGTG